MSAHFQSCSSRFYVVQEILLVTEIKFVNLKW